MDARLLKLRPSCCLMPLSGMIQRIASAFTEHCCSSTQDEAIIRALLLLVWLFASEKRERWSFSPSEKEHICLCFACLLS
ncbi:hypothetical protein DAI22_02g248650 [Oryza sativa Japonica Group]|nr:hypothetical protein DAI22_02g248650 [Oryza sativa Japonica Group]